MRKLKDILLSYRALYNWNNIDVKLIVSTGRTGTNFLANFFDDSQEELYSVHEPKPDLFHLSMAKFRGSKSIYGIQKNLKIKRYQQYKTAESTSEKIYIESNPNLAFLLPEAIQLFNNPRIVVVTRDIFSYIISAYNKSPDNSGNSFFYGENDRRKRLTLQDVKNDVPISDWRNRNRFEKIAWYWNYCNNYIIRSLHNYPFYQVKFEDLFGDNRVSEMKKLSKYLGVYDHVRFGQKKDELSKKMNTNSFTLADNFEKLPAELRKNIAKSTEKTRTMLGYNQ